MKVEKPAFDIFQIAQYPDLAPALIVKVNANPHRKEADALISAKSELQYFQAQLALFDVAGYSSLDFLEVVTAIRQLTQTFAQTTGIGVVNLPAKSAIETKLSARALPMLKIYPITQGLDVQKEADQIEKKNSAVAKLIRAYDSNVSPVVLIDLLAKK
jgi:hypothetical protein